MLQKSTTTPKTSEYRGYQITKSDDNLSAHIYKDGNLVETVVETTGTHPYLTAVRKARIYIDDLLKPIPMTPELIAEFKKEFAALLAKYDVQIGFHCDDGSDTYGITGEEIRVQQNKTNLVVVAASGWWMDRTDVI